MLRQVSSYCHKWWRESWKG